MICLSKNLARMALVAMISTIFATTAFAQTASQQESSTTKTKADKDVKKKAESTNSNPTLATLQGGGSGWQFQGTLSHTPKLRRDQEDTSDVMVRADYNINKKHTIRMQQFFTKFYGKYESEYEFKPFDTTVAHFYRSDWRPAGIGLQWRNQISIPISNESARDDLITPFQTSIVGSKALMGGKVLLFGIPYSRYFFYEYKTSKSGNLLPRWQNGLSLGALYFLTPKLSFYGGADYRLDTVYNSQFDQNAKQIPRGTYRFDASLAYQFTNSFSASLDYFQGRASYIQNGRYEIALFDDQVSRVGASLVYIY